MNTRWLAICIFALTIFALTIFALTPTCSKAQEPDVVQVCQAVGSVTLKLCAEQAVPGIKTDADKEFAKTVCVAAAYKSQSMCLGDKTSDKYQALGDCEGAALFTRDAITTAGKDVTKNYPESERKALLTKVENWAGAAGTRILLFCQDIKEKEAVEARRKADSTDL